MPLTIVPLETLPARPPPDVGRFIRAATRRVEQIQSRHRFPALVSSDFALAYEALRYLEESALAPGDRFCEWGSGPGVVCCLAAMTGFRAFGIESSGLLVREARRLAAHFDLPAEFVRGNFVLRGAKSSLLAGREFSWLSTGGRCGHEALGAAPDEFDLIYAYPWPDEESLVEALFEKHARAGALLLTYHGESGLLLRRKGGGRSSTG